MNGDGASGASSASLNTVAPVSGTYLVLVASNDNPSAASRHIGTGTYQLTATYTPYDTDGDGCPDVKEAGANALLGGDRDPTNPWDFFDTPEPVLTPSATTGTLNHAVTLADVIGILYYVGTSAASPTQANGNGVIYGSDLDASGVVDGREYDRTLPDASKPWRSGAPSGAVTIADAIIALNQVNDVRQGLRGVSAVGHQPADLLQRPQK